MYPQMKKSWEYCPGPLQALNGRRRRVKFSSASAS
jgi:hypothetical protein